MIVLDTNVLSEPMKKKPEGAVIQWLDGQPAPSLWTTAITVFEIRYGLALLARGRRRAALEKAFAVAMSEDFENRILPFDAGAADHAARLAALLKSKGKTVDIRDIEIAGICASRKATLATRNTRHFSDCEISLVNPWTDK